MRPPLENQHLLPWTLAVSERADGLRALVVEAREELVEVLRGEGFEEPFPAGAKSIG